MGQAQQRNRQQPPQPDELVVWRSPNDGEYYVTRFAASGDIRSVSSGYVNEDDAIANAEAQERPAVRRTTITEMGRPEWLTPRKARRRLRGRWARDARATAHGA